jgi:hypothetical protein
MRDSLQKTRNEAALRALVRQKDPMNAAAALLPAAGCHKMAAAAV